MLLRSDSIMSWPCPLVAGMRLVAGVPAAGGARLSDFAAGVTSSEEDRLVERRRADSITTRGLPEQPYPLHRFTVDDLSRLGDLGLIGEGVELIDGAIVHRGTGRLVAFFPADYEELVAQGVLRREDTAFVDGTIRDAPAAG
jgi:hypothetical protein